MNCLSIDASGPVCSAAVLKDGLLAYEAVLVREKAHASHLAPLAAEALSRAGISVNECDVIACVIGPGSFTGVRIGVATAQGLAFGADVPCAAVNALEALAYPYALFTGLICPILDARGGQVYAAAFRGNARILPDEALALTDFISKINGRAECFLFVGDGVAVHRQAVTAALGGRAFFGEEPLRASHAARLALASPETWLDPASLRPLYLRAPQAERERARRLAGEEKNV